MTGILYGGNGAKQLISQVIDVAVCIGWNVVIGGAIFFIIGKQDVVLWSDASTSPVALPDSRAR